MAALAVKYTLDNNRYFFGGSNDISLCNLGNFLTADLGKTLWPSFKVWALDDTQQSASTHITHLIKSHGYVLIGSVYTQEEPENYFSLPHEQFINLLEQWSLLQEMAIEELYIIFKDDRLKIFVIDKQGYNYMIAL